MARAYGQDLRERVVDAALSGLSARQAAERFGVGISTAIVWVRRAGAGERTARRQGQPKGSKLDAYADYVLDLVAETPHISLKEMQARLAEEKSVSAGVGTIWRFFATRAITFQKTAHAAEQDRADVLVAREAWFNGQLDLDPARLVFIDETGLSTKMAWASPSGVEGSVRNPSTPGGRNGTETTAETVHPRVQSPSGSALD
jgi:transposase